MGKEQQPGNENQTTFPARSAEPSAPPSGDNALPAVAALGPNEVTVFQVSVPAAEISKPPFVDTFKPNRRQALLLDRLAPGDSFAPGELKAEWQIKNNALRFCLNPLVQRGLLEATGRGPQRCYQRTNIPLPGCLLTQEELAAEYAAREKHNEYQRKIYKTVEGKESQHRANKKFRERKLHDLAFPLNKRQIATLEGLGIGALITRKQYQERFQVAIVTALVDLSGMVNRELLWPIGRRNKTKYLRIDPTRPPQENKAFAARQDAVLQAKPKTEREKAREADGVLVRNSYANGYHTKALLTPAEDMILNARFRAEGHRPTHEQLRETTAQVSRGKSASREWVRQLEESGLKKLERIRNRQLAAASIESLPVSKTAKNTLQATEITQVGQILGMSNEDLLAIRGFGPTSVWEIRNAITALLQILPHPDYEPKPAVPTI